MRAISSRAAAGVAGGALVLLALAGPASAAAPRGTSYGGVGTGENAVAIKLSPNGARVTAAAAFVDGVCDFGDTPHFNLGIRSPVPIAPNGAFTMKSDGTSSLGGQTLKFQTVVTGVVTGARIRGTATVTADVLGSDGSVVDRYSGASRFTARSQPGRVFAGITSQQAPVVAELVPSGIRVKHFHIGWSAGCSQDLTYSTGDTVTNFSIVRGRFGDEWTGNQTYQDGSRLSWKYTVRGRVIGKRVQGTFRFQEIMIDPEGVSVECDTGTVRYRAASG